ncbi:MAG: succinate dehydrogenase flavoprotein subunit [Acidobacteria bacterium]|nr:succinate dehydrogenase flavoprotein subunit [Acidobacteriota bacterium]MCA1610902.1 succinate dehydrogenase flavoprotein subunit [Acidobacteriota bacterium]MCA1617331.1 succinate dehydrogenase flavoprotein subunit [Acidobacteriota bacterium]
MANERIVVVGGGLAGLMTAVRAAELGVSVDLFSIVPVKRSHSVCAQGGINGAVNTKGEGDSTAIHFDDTVYGGDFLADQPPVKAMCDAAPGIINLLDRMGVMFNRTPEGLLDFRRFGGTKFHRTAFAGATTGQQLLYALDEQCRRYEVSGLVRKYEAWEFLGLVRDVDGNCRGITALDWYSMKIESFPASAVMLATGGPGIVFGRSTNSVINTGTAASAAYQDGAHYANGEFIQVHPTSIPGTDKLRLMSESARGEGGRVWVPRTQGDTRDPKSIPEGERWYFLEEKYPAYGNLVPRDIATREIFQVCLQGYGLGGRREVYLDLTHIPRKELDTKLGGILEIYEKFVGDDPREVPMKVFPGMHYSMGGLWVQFGKNESTGALDETSSKNQSTNVPGLFASGEVDFSIHGANRLGANSLVSCLYAGKIGGPAMVRYGRETSSKLPAADGAFTEAKKRWDAEFARLANVSGPENPHVLAQEMGDWMTDNVTVVRENGKLKETETKLQELEERWKNVGLTDRSGYANREISFINQLRNMLVIARVMTRGALMRDESRGAHFKVRDLSKGVTEENALPRDDANFLKTTIAEHSADGPKISYAAVDTSLIEPRARKY